MYLPVVRIPISVLLPNCISVLLPLAVRGGLLGPRRHLSPTGSLYRRLLPRLSPAHVLAAIVAQRRAIVARPATALRLLTPTTRSRRLFTDREKSARMAHECARLCDSILQARLVKW